MTATANHWADKLVFNKLDFANGDAALVESAFKAWKLDANEINNGKDLKDWLAAFAPTVEAKTAPATPARADRGTTPSNAPATANTSKPTAKEQAATKAAIKKAVVSEVEKAAKLTNDHVMDSLDKAENSCLDSIVNAKTPAERLAAYKNMFKSLRVDLA